MSTPVRGCWRESTPTSSIRWGPCGDEYWRSVGQNTHMQRFSLSFSRPPSRSLMHTRQCSNSHSAQYFIGVCVQHPEHRASLLVCVCVCVCVTLYSMYVDLWLIYMLALITNHISALGLWGRRSTDTNEKGWVRRESISVGIMVMKHKDEERIFFNNPTLDVRQTAEGFFTAAGLSRENFTTAFILIKKRNRRNLN